MSSRKNRSPEEQARRAKIRELLQESNVSSMADIQNLFKQTIAESTEAGLNAEAGWCAWIQQVRLQKQGHRRDNPADDSLFKILYLAMMDITKKWTGRRQDWSVIYAQPAIFFGDRMPE